MRRRNAAVALAALTLALGALLAGQRPTSAAGAQLTIDPPGHGTFSETFTANYSWGGPCLRSSVVVFSWEGTPIGSARVADHTCAVAGAQLAPPAARPDLLTSGPHTVAAAVPGFSASHATTIYVLDPAEGAPGGGPTPISIQPQDGSPTPAATPVPTPAASATPPQPITATFPPHNCENGVPDGPTPCPSTTGDALALATGPPPAAATTASSRGSGVPATLVLGAAIAVLAAVVLGLVARLLVGLRRG